MHSIIWIVLWCLCAIIAYGFAKRLSVPQVKARHCRYGPKNEFICIVYALLGPLGILLLGFAWGLDLVESAAFVRTRKSKIK
ncbi:hypothetical protein A2926_04610 [Candidatus Giovannonibacteria bacterium RIFCSPLOWO2_01_FULL_44_40]|uniref:Uncharacterized protein n=1 Tax=Candidatus Giovannonibacteria bacterium RIFCSPHIGHO2_01_FULL_45_23 TaxID=1798325 RepID=A0A1F5VIF4_9BACT|nr:MAG: hypothetical protein A2834_03055 [Candidatus Giovannonibacteria bacterium RIFCSPHIGHO2_01_FULL_45_23]OGF75611.1 MAG: hypothetical protein A3C77_00915 [Candidatus Giovannonibacteria bacterium RIFCSPHIGHO2_02_FULL_45_13]OGF80118.1 MAG: hypothetical protein A2926_04610 [Candidatus Giovannonibacteria bacterium RIFCSPLOWO2_01_FULL_44_40]